MATTTPTHPAAPRVGERRQLATYALASGQRIVYGQRILGHVRLIDAPTVAAEGRSWVIESNLEQEGRAAMDALVADYVSQAERHQTIPAGPGAVTAFINALDDLDLAGQ